MAHSSDHKNSAELEREVEAQRSRVEQTIGEIRERLSPGQLVDELLSYTKDGGAHFASSLGRSVVANPIPAALLGVSLAWLMAGNRLGQGHEQRSESSRDWSREDSGRWSREDRTYPYATIRGSGLQRVSHAADEMGVWYSEFIDDEGQTYRARSDQSGKRSGHFIDATGRIFGGFVDEAGNRIEQFRDEAGNLLDEASGWASHTWHDVREAVNRGASGVAHAAARIGGDVQSQASRLTRTLIDELENQPLVAGALAFAVGAALGAALPRTRQEDQVMGKAADQVKREAGHMANELYEKGKEQAAGLYEEAAGKAGEVYEKAKSTLTGPDTGGNGQRPTSH